MAKYLIKDAQGNIGDMTMFENIIGFIAFAAIVGFIGWKIYTKKKGD